MRRFFLFIILFAFALFTAITVCFFHKSEEETPIAAYETQETAVISCAQPAISFGTIREADGPVEHQFVIANTGKVPLLLISCEGSCGCTTAEWSQEPIPAGGTGFVTITYTPKGMDGKFVKEVNVVSNATIPVFKLTVQGEVIGSKQ